MNSALQEPDHVAEVNNPGFNSLEFEGIRNEVGRNSFFLSAKKWVDLTFGNETFTAIHNESVFGRSTQALKVRTLQSATTPL